MGRAQTTLQNHWANHQNSQHYPVGSRRQEWLVDDNCCCSRFCTRKQQQKRVNTKNKKRLKQAVLGLARFLLFCISTAFGQPKKKVNNKLLEKETAFPSFYLKV
jgi:hypothetical protein